MKKILNLSFLVFIAHFSQAQTFKFADVSFFGNTSSTTASPLSKGDKDFLNSNFSIPLNSTQQLVYNSNRYSKGVGVMAGWNINQPNSSKSKLQHKLRASILFSDHQLNFGDYEERRTSTRIDTLISQQTGKMYFIDSVHAKTVGMSHHATMFNLDLSYIVHLNLARKFSLHTGVGAGMAMSMQNYLLRSESEYMYKTNFDQRQYAAIQSNSMNSFSSITRQESKNLYLATNYRAYIPFGLNYRMSNRSPFFKQLSLFMEYNLGVEVNSMDGIQTNVGIYNALNAGIRLSFIDFKSNRNRRHTAH